MARRKKKKFKIDKRLTIIVSLVVVTLLCVLVFSRKEDISRDNYRIELDKSLAKVFVGEEVKLGYTIYHSNNKNQIIWSTADSSIATIDSNGIIRGVSFGEVAITAELVGANKDSINLIVMSHPVYFKINTEEKPIKGWFNKEVHLTFEYQNIDNIKYCIVTKEVCEPNINYKGKITLKNGTWHLYIKGIDKNNKEFRHNEIFKVDLEKPKCSANRLGKWGNENASIEVICNPDLSGIDRYEWYRDDARILVTTIDKINANDIYINGKHKYSVKIYDNVGNASIVKIN